MLLIKEIKVDKDYLENSAINIDAMTRDEISKIVSNYLCGEILTEDTDNTRKYSLELIVIPRGHTENIMQALNTLLRSEDELIKTKAIQLHNILFK